MEELEKEKNEQWEKLYGKFADWGIRKTVYLLDTNICIAVLNGNSLALMKLERQLSQFQSINHNLCRGGLSGILAT
jgi:hypothetical protein